MSPNSLLKTKSKEVLGVKRIDHRKLKYEKKKKKKEKTTMPSLDLSHYYKNTPGPKMYAPFVLPLISKSQFQNHDFKITPLKSLFQI